MRLLLSAFVVPQPIPPMTIRNKILSSVFAAAALLGPATIASAQPFETSTSWLEGFDDWINELSAMKMDDFQFAVGAGVGTTADYPGGDNYDTVGLPLFQLRYKDKLTIDPLGVRFRFWRSDCCRARLLLSLSESRSANADSAVAKLLDVDRGINTGFVFEGRVAGPLAARFQLRKEIAGGHSGLTATTAIGLVLRDKTESYSVIPELAVTWASNNYMDAFYSVTPAGSLASRLTPFDASSGFREVSFRVTTSYRFNEKWLMVGRLQAEKLLGDVKHSSIVRQAGDSFQGLLGMGVMYTF